MSKFNRTRKTKVAGFFPITQHRFNTSQHPALLMPGRAQEKFTLSGQELQMLQGLANILETNDVGALRIALWEALGAHPESLERYVSKARAGATAKGHSGRNHRVAALLPREMKDQLYQTCGFPVSGLTPAEQIRLSVIWLAKGIRDDRITKLTNSKKRSQEELAKAWCLVNQDRPRGSKLTALKEAQTKALAEAEEAFLEERQRLFDEGGHLIDQAVADGMFGVLWDPVSDDKDNFDVLRAHYHEASPCDEELTEENLEAYIDSLIESGFDPEEAREAALEELQEAKATAADLADWEPDWDQVGEMEALGWSTYDAMARVEYNLPLEPPPQEYIEEREAAKAAGSKQIKSLSANLDLAQSFPLEDSFC